MWRRNCDPFVYPTPFELHFSNAHRESCKKDLFSYCRDMHGTDRDLAAHFTVIRKAGFALCGTDAASLFGEVPEEAYLVIAVILAQLPASSKEKAVKAEE